MVKLKGPLFSISAKGKMKDAICFQDGVAGPRAMVVPTHRDAYSSSQSIVRASFLEAVSSWNALDEEDKNFWESQAQGKRMTGYNLYIKLYLAGVIVYPALDFNGISDYCWAPHDTSIDFAGVMSIEAWIKPGAVDVATQEVVAKRSSQAGVARWCSYAMGLSDAKFNVAYMATGGAWHSYSSDDDVFSVGTWYYAVATMNPGTPGDFHLYVNGSEVNGSWVLGNGTAGRYVTTALCYFGCYLGVEDLLGW